MLKKKGGKVLSALSLIIIIIIDIISENYQWTNLLIKYDYCKKEMRMQKVTINHMIIMIIDNKSAERN